MNLDSIRVVLVGTTHSGNIGSTARAMKTMGLSRLHLVSPQSFPSPQAQAMAASAADVLEAARVHESLEAALAGATLVAGLSARPRRLASPALTLRECAPKLVAEAAHAPVALLFGREHSGLTNEELDHCQFLVHIPANPAYGSLNLAAAVQVVCYELRMAALTEPAAAKRSASAAAVVSADHLEEFYGFLEQLCRETGFADGRNDGMLMRRLRRLFNRARPDEKEINILRGLMSYATRRQP
jgi:TrmH family RNA methyltransferase